MFARAAIFCAVLLVLGAGLAAAENRSLLLGDRATQSIGDVDFMLPPIWHSLVKCGERITSESCLLQRFVPAGHRAEAAPCRFIELTEQGQSVEDFYRTGTQADMEDALSEWLRIQIKKIEKERGLTPKLES